MTDYTKTIKELREKRDFYAAAISALEKISAHETPKAAAGAIPHKRGGGVRTPEQRARMAAASRLMWQRRKAEHAADLSTDNGSEVVQ